MIHSSLITLCVLAGTALLAIAAVHDVGFRTVPNRISVALLGIGLLVRALHGDVASGLLCGSIVFAVTYAFWRFGWMGGADVKLLTAASVFVPPSMVLTLVTATSMAGGVLALAYLAAGRFVPRPGRLAPSSGLLRRAARCELRRLRRRGPLPYATAIATGGWLAVAWS